MSGVLIAAAVWPGLVLPVGLVIGRLLRSADHHHARGPVRVPTRFALPRARRRRVAGAAPRTSGVLIGTQGA